jgi:serine/threonine protein phosphatase PrpC
MALPENRLTVRAAMACDRGKVRQENEDACVVAPERGLFIVSDGMGGHQAGAIASRIVVNVLPALLAQQAGHVQLSPEGIHQALARAAADLSTQLRQEAAKHPDLVGMGATVVLLLVAGGQAHIMHLGDSRAYLLRQSRLRRLTQDHTVAALLLRLKEITEEEAREHQGAHRLTRYMGMDGDALPDIRTLRLEAGDRLMLCSDGLTGMVSDRHIAHVLRQHPRPEDACQALVAAANAAGSRDNVSAIVIDVDAVPPDGEADGSALAT